MVRQFENYIRQNQLISPNDSVLLAVSGGIDSMVMTRLFELSEFNFAIAHCNFRLRGIESDDDASFIENYSKIKNIKFHSELFDTKAFAGQHKISIQMAARQLRVNWLEKLSELHGYSFYATAHHKDDQIETFFINMLRGTGISGLHGILPIQGRLIHPMLFTNRKEIEKFARKNNIQFRQDSSNQRSDYTRNKIRNQLLPLIREINPQYDKILTENIYRLKQAETVYFQQIKSAESKVVFTDEKLVKIPIQRLLTLEPIETYLYEFVAPYNFNFSDVKNIVNALNKQSGKQFLSKTHRLIKDRDYLIIEKIEEEPFIGRYEVFRQTSELLVPLRIEFNLKTIPPNFKNNENPDQAYIDAEKLTYPLEIRKWEKGDYFYPLGMNRKKLISNFLIDNKFSLLEKERIWLLSSAGQVVWVIGQRIDNRFKVTDATQNFLCIQVKN